MYDSVHCTEAENVSKHKKRELRATTSTVQWLANRTRRHVVTGSTLMTDTIETALYP